MKNKTIHVALFIVYLITALAGLIFASLYLFRGEFMPYHEVAVGKSWQMLNNEYQVLILALMRVSGGGWLATSVAILLLLFGPLRKGMYWPYYAIPIIGLAALIPSLVATLYVKIHSPADPPYLLAAVLSGLLIIALVISLICKHK